MVPFQSQKESASVPFLLIDEAEVTNSFFLWFIIVEIKLLKNIVLSKKHEVRIEYVDPSYYVVV